ncbi:MAG: TM0106 family RecB-like putative nuclease [Patescibacteria group bacterium]|nr:TM0106 family RecB-like putative nuclease [Patescibacteria group bacterium]
MQYITATKLYDYLQCPHKVWRDAHGPQEEKIKEVNPFVQMLWDRGIAHEKEIVARLGELRDLKEAGSHEERFKKTLQAIKDGVDLIYQGILIHEDHLGIPDLLQKMPDGKYVPVDIKSGMAKEGIDNENGSGGKLKDHYALQLCFYVDLLKRLDISNTGKGVIIDARGNREEYDLDSLRGIQDRRTWWEFFDQCINNVKVLLANEDRNKPAMSGKCKLCPWYNSCKTWCKENGDLTCLFYVGRSQRDKMEQELGVSEISNAIDLDVGEILAQKKKDKNFLKGVGKSTLEKTVRRARIMSQTKKPVAHKKIEFPEVSVELFFDIEDDPTQEFVYMHGVWERKGEKERFLHFTAKEKISEAEEKAWADFWQYIRSLPKDDFAVYYYSSHEKTTYRKMQKLYPDVVSAEEVEDFFANPNVIDLYRIVSKFTDWPLGSYSLKDIAQYLGFSWRDETPSGALSIEWFNKYLETGDEKILERILLYNEDDCKATMVLKDGIEKLSKDV